jgi:hypothetical protein
MDQHLGVHFLRAHHATTLHRRQCAGDKKNCSL